MIRLAVCDDESYMREELCSLVSKYMEERCSSSYDIAEFENGKALLESRDRFDLIFLDI